MEFDKNKILINGEEKNVIVDAEVNVRSELCRKIEIPLVNIKKVFVHYGISNKCEMVYERDDVALNFVIECPDFVVSFFVAIYS